MGEKPYIPLLNRISVGTMKVVFGIGIFVLMPLGFLFGMLSGA